MWEVIWAYVMEGFGIHVLLLVEYVRTQSKVSNRDLGSQELD